MISDGKKIFLDIPTKQFFLATIIIFSHWKKKITTNKILRREKNKCFDTLSRKKLSIRTRFCVLIPRHPRKSGTCDLIP